MNTITIDDKQLAVNAMIHNMKEIDPDGSHAGLISPIEALSYVRAHHVDVAFLDIEMPDMNIRCLNTQLNLEMPTTDPGRP